MNSLIEKQLSQKEIFDLFLIQLYKDFEMSGIPADFVYSLPSRFLDLKQQLKTQLFSAFKSSSESLPNLLYRVDISENQLKTSTASSADFYDSLAETIIKRVLQKVILKKQFSS